MTAEPKQVADARKWLAESTRRQNIGTFATLPPRRLEDLQTRQILDLPEIIKKWLSDTAKVGTRADLQRIFDAAHNEFFPNLRNQVRQTFEELSMQCLARELEASRLVAKADEVEASKRSAVANLKREREAIAAAQKALDVRKARLAALEEGRP